MPHNIIRKKIDASNLFNCSDLTEFTSSIVKILPYEGVSMSRFYICEVEGIRFLTKLCFYRKEAPEIYGKVNRDLLAHVDAEINILKILRDKIIDNNISHCILELVYEKVCDGLGKITPKEKICEQLVLDYKETRPEDDVEQLLCKYSDLVKNNLAYDKCAFLVLEKCDMSLDEYLLKSINTPVSLAVFKSLLFQIIYTMYAINYIYPGFRHYDLHTDNIMLKFDPNYKFKATNPKFLVYHIDGERYSVPYFGIIPKIIDFGFSSLPEEGIVSNATDDKVRMYYRSNNDLLFLFRFIHYTLSRSGGDKLGRVDKILSNLEPNRTYVQYYTEHIRKIEDKIPTYEQMVRNRVFDEYKKHAPPKTQIYNEFTPLTELQK